MTKLTQIGIILSAHGVRGQVKIRSLTHNPEAIFSYNGLTDKTGKRPFSLTRHGGHSPDFIAGIEGITDRNAADLLRGTGLFIPASALPPKDKNQWYASELVGLQARLENGDVYGTITAVHNFGAGDIIEVEKAGKGSELLPFNDAFVGFIDAFRGYLVVFPPHYTEDDA